MKLQRIRRARTARPGEGWLKLPRQLGEAFWIECVFERQHSRSGKIRDCDWLPRSIKPPDLECRRRCISEDLVLDCHPFEAPLAPRSIGRSRLSSCLYGSDVGDRLVGSIVPAEDD